MKERKKELPSNMGHIYFNFRFVIVVSISFLFFLYLKDFGIVFGHFSRNFDVFSFTLSLSLSL